MGSERVSPAGSAVWIDAQLPPALARWLREEHGVAAEHIDHAGHLGSDDRAIFAAARDGGVGVVVTKDDDFVLLLDQHGPPPQVVWVTCGNVRNAELRRLMLAAWPRVAALLEAGEPLVEVRGDGQ